MQAIGSILKGIIPGISQAQGLDLNEASAPHKFIAVGIDPGKKRCGVAIVDATGDPQAYLKPVKEFMISNDRKGLNRMVYESASVARKLHAHPVFVCEATNVYWKPIYWHLHKQGAIIQTVNPLGAALLGRRL